MKTQILGATAGLILLCAAGSGEVRADDDAQFDKDISTLGNALKSHDYATIVDMMYTPVVKAGGGRDNVIAQAASVGNQAVFVSFETIKPYRRISGSQNDYAVIPTLAVMDIESKRVESHSYQLAVQPHGESTWQYVDGAGMTPPLQAMFFGDMPSGTVLPEHTMKLIDSSEPVSPLAQESQSAKADSGQILTSGIPETYKSSSLKVILLLGGASFALSVIIILLLFFAMYSRPKSSPSRPLGRVPPMK